MDDYYDRFGEIPGLFDTRPGLPDMADLSGTWDTVLRRGEAGSPTDRQPEGAPWSPAEEKRLDVWRLPTARVLLNVREGLRRPGRPADYHNLLQVTADQLWSRRRDDPGLLPEIETLCWLDMRLALAMPDKALPGPSGYPVMSSPRLLRIIYEQAGDKDRALDVAGLAEGIGQCDMDGQVLRFRAGHTDVYPVLKIRGWHAKGFQPLQSYQGRISDHAFCAADPAGPLGGSWVCSYPWRDSTAWLERFEGLWTPTADRLADSLADRYGFSWPWLTGKALATADPDLYDAVLTMVNADDLGGSNRDYGPHRRACDLIASGAFQIVRRRRDWTGPSPLTCPACHGPFWSGDLLPWAIRAYGSARYCMDCCSQARDGNPRQHWTASEILDAVRELADALGYIPPQGYAGLLIPGYDDESARDRTMRALLAMPHAETVKRILRQPDWLGVLHAVGLVEDTWRPARGTYCRAADGHRCRSLLEKSIDDWFSRNSIAHECEPLWPRHDELNPHGRMRADWRLTDGTYVECAGMLDDEKYGEKITSKIRLARSAAIPLIIVAPTDMHRLSMIFASWVA